MPGRFFFIYLSIQLGVIFLFLATWLIHRAEFHRFGLLIVFGFPIHILVSFIVARALEMKAKSLSKVRIDPGTDEMRWILSSIGQMSSNFAILIGYCGSLLVLLSHR